MTQAQASFRALADSVLPKLRKFLIESGADKTTVEAQLNDNLFCLPDSVPGDADSDEVRTLFFRNLIPKLAGAANLVEQYKGRNPDQQTAVLLHHGCGVSYAEIGLHTGVAEGTVKSRIARGLGSKQ